MGVCTLPLRRPSSGRTALELAGLLRDRVVAEVAEDVVKVARLVVLRAEAQVAAAVEPHRQRLPRRDEHPLPQVELALEGEQRALEVLLRHQLLRLAVLARVCAHLHPGRTLPVCVCYTDNGGEAGTATAMCLCVGETIEATVNPESAGSTTSTSTEQTAADLSRPHDQQLHTHDDNATATPSLLVRCGVTCTLSQLQQTDPCTIIPCARSPGLSMYQCTYFTHIWPLYGKANKQHQAKPATGRHTSNRKNASQQKTGLSMYHGALFHRHFRRVMMRVGYCNLMWWAMSTLCAGGETVK